MKQRPKSSALVMCFADASGNPRPNRIISLLSNIGFDVDLMAYAPRTPISVRNIYSISKPNSALYSKAFRMICGFGASIFSRLGSGHLAESLYELRFGFRNLDAALSDEKYDVVIVEDLQFLPLAFRKYGRNKKSKIIFDAREYYPKQNEGSLKFELMEVDIRIQLCRNYLSQCDYLMTVSHGFAQSYRENFSVEMQVFRSTPKFRSVEVKPTKGNTIRLVYHGMAAPNRGLENMIETVKRLDDRFTLDLYLVSNPRYIHLLRRKAKDCLRVKFNEPVPYADIITMLNRYDVGFFYYESDTFNIKYCLPNKYFEFIQARLAIAIGPSPEMSELTEYYGNGFVAEQFTIDSMVETLSSLSKQDIDKAKNGSDKAAGELCFEKESQVFVNALEAILDGD